MFTSLKTRRVCACVKKSPDDRILAVLENSVNVVYLYSSIYIYSLYSVSLQSVKKKYIERVILDQGYELCVHVACKS